MRRLLNYFLQGLVLLAPVAITVWVVWTVIVTVDRWLDLPIPGAGFVVTVALITLVGFLASNFLARGAIALVDRVLGKLPFVRLLYHSTRDLLNAFVGEKRRFDAPVLVTIGPGLDARALGFVTQESLEHFCLADHVAVYLPQSYNFAGQVLVFPRSAVTRLHGKSSDVLAFIVSGGVTEVPGPQSLDGTAPAGIAARGTAPATPNARA